MTVNEILNLDSSKKHEFRISTTDEWERCYYQENKTAHSVDSLPQLDEEYHYGFLGAGELLENSAGNAVFDPFSTIKYEFLKSLTSIIVFNSTNLVSLIQKKIKSLVDSNAISKNSMNDSVLEVFQNNFEEFDFESIISELEREFEIWDSDISERKSTRVENVLWFRAHCRYSSNTTKLSIKESLSH